MELKKYRLGEIVDFNKETISRQDNLLEIKYLDTSNILDNVIYETPSMKLSEAPSRAQRKVKHLTIIYSTVRPRLKHHGILQMPPENLIVSTGFATLDIKDSYENMIDATYLYLLLTQSSVTEYLGNIADTAVSAYPSINPSDISSLSFIFPDITIQRKIASIWTSYDQKIHLNSVINDNLEAMAKQLYDYWFVQFDFPNEDGKPYKSSGGAMVWNEKLKREIPQGWSDCVLGDYIGRITNGLNPRKNFVLGSGNNYYVTIRSLVGTTIDWNNCDRCDDEALSKINSRSQLQIGDIIFSAIGTIGRTYYILEEPTNWNISETSFTLRAKENVPNDFFYGMLRSNEIQIKADKAAMGSTLRCLVMDSLCSLQYIKIPSYMMKLFAAKVSPLYRQIHRNNKEIAELTKQRDELLPLLMNGQATVNYHLSL